MRYNEEIQTMADQCAREDDLFCFAAYIGRCQDFHVLHGDIFVFRPMHEDNIPRNEGFPHYITVLNGEADLHSDSYTLELYNNSIKRYNNAKGRQMIKSFERRIVEGDFASVEERESVVSIVDYCKSPLCDKSELYAYLAASDRFNMKLELFADEANSRRIFHDGVDELEKFIRLIPVRKGKFAKRLNLLT